MGWGIFEKLFSKKQRSNSQPAISTRQSAALKRAAANKNSNRRASEHPAGNRAANRSNSTNNMNSTNNSSLASASSAPDLASQIRTRSALGGKQQTATSISAARPTPKSFGEVLNPEAVDTDDEVNTNFSIQDKDKDKSSLANNNTNNKSNTMSRSNYQSSESSSESKEAAAARRASTVGDLSSNEEPAGGKLSPRVNLFTAQSAQNQVTRAKGDNTESENTEASSKTEDLETTESGTLQKQRPARPKSPTRPVTDPSNAESHFVASTAKKQTSNFDPKSFGQVSAINPVGGRTLGNTTQSVTFREPESTVLGQSNTGDKYKNKNNTSTRSSGQVSLPNLNTSYETFHQETANLSNDSEGNGQKSKYSSSRVENQNQELRKRVEELESQLVEKATKEKRQIDLLMAKFHDGMASQTEKEQLRRLFVSKQQAQNERLINEQQRRIETLQAKVQPDTVTARKVGGGATQAEMEALRKELADFKSLVYRLNVAAEDKDQALVIARNKLDYMEKSQTESEKIRQQAEVVLEENGLLRESLEQKEARLAEAERTHIKEVGRLAKRLIIVESDKVNVLGQLDLFQENHDELAKKFNRASAELQRRVTLEEHLNKTGDLQRKIEEIGMSHRQEMEATLVQLEATKTELTNLGCKYTSLLGENRKLQAENEVLEKALEHGAGRKTQRKLQELESRLEAAQQAERLAKAALERLAKDVEKLSAENKGLVAMAKASEQETKKIERRLFEEGLRASRCEERFAEFKEKAAITLARSMHKSGARFDKLSMAKVSCDRKLSDIVNLLERKHTQIDGYLTEKKIIESEVENFCETTLSENKKFRQVLSPEL